MGTTPKGIKKFPTGKGEPRGSGKVVRSWSQQGRGKERVRVGGGGPSSGNSSYPDEPERKHHRKMAGGGKGTSATFLKDLRGWGGKNV